MSETAIWKEASCLCYHEEYRGTMAMSCLHNPNATLTLTLTPPSLCCLTARRPPCVAIRRPAALRTRIAWAGGTARGTWRSPERRQRTVRWVSRETPPRDLGNALKEVWDGDGIQYIPTHIHTCMHKSIHTHLLQEYSIYIHTYIHTYIVHSFMHTHTHL